MAGECTDALPPADLGDHSWFAYLEVDDVDGWYDRMRRRGAGVVAPIADEPRGMREFVIRTGDGHRVTFGARTAAA